MLEKYSPAHEVRGVKTVSSLILNGIIPVNKLTSKYIYGIYGIMLMMNYWISSTSGNREAIVRETEMQNVILRNFN